MQTILVGATANLLCANVVLTELEIGTAGVAVARRLTHALQAQLIADALATRRTNGTANASITNRSRRTLIVAATILNGHAAQRRITRRSRLTGTNANVIIYDAIGILATRMCQRTRIHTFGVETRFRLWTIVVVAALDQFAFDRGIAACICRTFAESTM